MAIATHAAPCAPAAVPCYQRQLSASRLAASLCTQGCAPKAVRACSQALVAELGLVKQAVKVPLVEVLALVKEVHEGVSTVNQELALCPVADLEDDLASEAASRASEEDEAALLTLSLSISLTLSLSTQYP